MQDRHYGFGCTLNEPLEEAVSKTTEALKSEGFGVLTTIDVQATFEAKLGIERFGAAGDEFDPNHHEALMRMEADLPEGATTTTVVQVLLPGYRMGERIVRAARVAVADPQ